MDHLTDAQRRALVALAADRPGPSCRVTTLRALVRRGLVRTDADGPALTDEGRALAATLANEAHRTPVRAPTSDTGTWTLRDAHGAAIVRVEASSKDEAFRRVAAAAPTALARAVRAVRENLFPP